MLAGDSADSQRYVGALIEGNWFIGAALAFLIATATTPAGISGAVFLLPVQVSILEIPSPSVTPTNLLFNVLATPGALLRFARDGKVGRRSREWEPADRCVEGVGR